MREGRVGLFNGPENEFRDAALLRGITLGEAVEVIHVDINGLEAGRRRCRGRSRLVCIHGWAVGAVRCRGVGQISVGDVGGRLGGRAEEVRRADPAHGQDEVNTKEAGGVRRERRHYI